MADEVTTRSAVRIRPERRISRPEGRWSRSALASHLSSSSRRPVVVAVGTAALTAFALLVTACGTSAELPWPQWRGPQGAGVYTGGPLPSTWSGDGQGVRWKSVVPGVGTSSPVVGDGLVYLTSSYPVSPDDAEGPHHRAVLAFDTVTGELVWQRELFSAPPEKSHWLNSLAGPTPATDGASVFAYFGSTLARIDRRGEVLWTREIDPDYQEFARYGAASSPILYGELLILLQDKERAQTEDVGWIAAFDRESGERRWRTEWTNTCCSYSTPIVAERGDRPEILVAQSGAVISYDLETGERLWLHEYPMLQMVSTAVLEGDLLAILGGADNRRGNLVMRLEGHGAETEVVELWQNTKASPQVSSPVLYEGILYSLSVPGVLVAWRPESGEVIWQQRLSRGRNHASLIAGDGKIFAASSSGTVAVMAAGPEPILLGENELGERGTPASLAAGDGCLLQRGERHLFCFEAASE